MGQDLLIDFEVAGKAAQNGRDTRCDQHRRHAYHEW
jgi:hypothetical protein